ncbi:hypothetical protein Asp14428_72310 [Actinoplanes sp. NBRC 14428]|nr:hypothetical protein Asp14428_72310 [Actinoplanes sp. NBRC 14428]
MQSNMPPHPQHLPQSPINPLKIPGVGHHHHDTPPTPHARRRSLGDPGRPVLPRQSRPHGPGIPPPRQRPQKRHPGRISPPPVAVPTSRRRVFQPSIADRPADDDAGPSGGRPGSGRGSGTPAVARRCEVAGPGNNTGRDRHRGLQRRAARIRLTRHGRHT